MKRITILVLFFALVLTATACQPKSRPGLVLFGDATATPEPANTTVQGVWQTAGVGGVLEVKGTTVNFYMATRKTCFKQETIELKVVLNQVFQGAIPVGSLTQEGDRMTFTNRFSGESTTYQRLDTLPESCLNIDEKLADDPVYNYEGFWNSFNENYPFFALREVDWQKQYDRFISQVDEDTTDTELSFVYRDMLTELKDCGAFVVRFNSEESPYEYPKDWVTIRAEIPRTVQKKYMIESKWTSTGRMLYGKLNNRIGYIYIRVLSPQQGEEDNKALLEELDTAFESLSGVSSLVIDLRSSPYRTSGSYALLLASYLVDKETPAYIRQTRDLSKIDDLSALTEPETVMIKPDPDRPVFARPVYVLTGPLMYAGSEKFALIASSLPNVTLVGMPTAGCPADSAYFPLPDGMVAGIPYEITQDIDGKSYDKDGIPPDVPVNMSKDDWLAGRDPMIEVVLKEAQ